VKNSGMLFAGTILLTEYKEWIHNPFFIFFVARIFYGILFYSNTISHKRLPISLKNFRARRDENHEAYP
jgi:hypothetical protein